MFFKVFQCECVCECVNACVRILCVVCEVVLSVGLVQYSNRGQYSALVGLHDVSVDYHLVQHHVSSVNIEHYLSATHTHSQG